MILLISEVAGCFCSAPFQIKANFSCLFVVISGNLFVESFISFVHWIRTILIPIVSVLFSAPVRFSDSAQ
jgi:hypothetical protein